MAWHPPQEIRLISFLLRKQHLNSTHPNLHQGRTHNAAHLTPSRASQDSGTQGCRRRAPASMPFLVDQRRWRKVGWTARPSYGLTNRWSRPPPPSLVDAALIYDPALGSRPRSPSTTETEMGVGGGKNNDPSTLVPSCGSASLLEMPPPWGLGPWEPGSIPPLGERPHLWTARNI